LPTSAEHLLLDTSAAIAASYRSNPAYSRLRKRLRGRTVGFAGHAQTEFYSSLTRLPEPMRVSGAVAARIIADDFPATRWLPERAQQRLVSEFAALGIVGGAVYDGLVGAAARHHRLTLLSCDRRAERTYQALGVDYELF
jgi:hypothetical protein